MPKMTLVWIAIYTMAVFGSFVTPVIGVLGYLFEYYLRPAFHWWGTELPDLRWNLTIAVVLVTTYLLRRSSLPQIGPWRKGPARFLGGLLVVMLLVLPIAANQRLSWGKTIEYSKMILFHALVVATVRSTPAFDAFSAVHMAGASWWGWEAYQNPKRVAGRLANVGSGDTRGDNGAAAHLLTVVPFIAVYFALHQDKRLRLLALIAAPFVLNTIILCNSRGAIVGLVAMGFSALWLAQPGHRLRMAGAGLALAIGLYVLADPQFIQRQQASTTLEVDGSIEGRLKAWRGAVTLVAENPFGTGGQGFWELSDIYAADLVNALGEKRDPHNTVVLVASEWGIIGLILFLGYYVSVFRVLREVKKSARDSTWFYRAVAIQVALVGIFVSGLFTDRLYAEAPYWMGALAVALHRIHANELKLPVSAVEPAPAVRVGSARPMPRAV